MNRRIPNGTYGGVRGRRLAASSYSIKKLLEDLLTSQTLFGVYSK